MASRLKGKVAIITGAGSGIGQGTALLFAREGATVVAVDLNAKGLQETVEASRKNGFPIDPVSYDLTSEDGVSKLMAHVVEKHGGIDTLVTAAGFVEFASVPEMTLEQWHRTLKGELDIVFLPVRAAWPHMIGRGGGSIINFGSISAWGATRSMGAVAHSTGKGGVVSMTRQMAYEGAPHKIRANSVSPGIIHTPAAQFAFDNLPGFEDGMRANTMLGRHGKPEDVAWGIVYLASDEASWVTGVDLKIDGGLTAW
ncbi:SDR family NAD(P)-dependent oxidoreductase [Mesorhizobium escarrei]|uniref:3-oxoacyl-(Acyl-carrier-protein) reductase FabG n=1 Tax=Mesorhizobium escarrei TaxID=666018 RepID=A0ABM9E4T7_9HYPH|nr:SDR family NAD(P)-dependent oxidoreductase [Mesorhizobium escarrei]CAH2404131.1 3-oxoacyl-(acyl-carrier-protein) reductase FabG [Mesorhizobium escarrei]